ncbi:hypothetical protein K466DRAFT_595416 [Polyporus arcularius HHB13444]|uniref:F-box domain-containing protein n=1 Tax=Polyporus arcularius HHB13444 TaxID=1314778 RepID=A0A5C3PRZ5_9APHY|nr:hypothetical protein K466DRAFT_595416 [Polyporus arcularius HHB13444]
MRPGTGEAYFCNAVHFLPSIFADAPLEELVFSGDIGVVREETWRSLFSSFPRLKTLVLENNTLSEHGDARRVFAALRSQQSPDDPGAVCPLLEYIWVRNTPCEISDLEEVMKFIEWRIARRVPLKRLRLELALFEDEDDTIKEYRTKFGHLVETSILDVEDWALTPNRTTEHEFPFGSI